MRIMLIVLLTLIMSSCSIYPDDSSKVTIKIINPSDNNKDIRITTDLMKPNP